MTKILDTLERYTDYLKLERQLSRQTIVAYTRDLHLLQAHINKPVEQITRDDLRQYMRELTANGAARATVRRKMQGFSTYFKWLKMERVVTEPATDGLIVPARKKRVPKFLSTEQLQTFLDTPTPVYHLMNADRDLCAFRLLAFTGIRRGELLNLQVQDVNLSEQIIIIREGKGGNDRSIPISDEKLRTLLETVIAGRSEGWLLLSAYGNRWEHQSFTSIFRKHVQNCGLEGVTPHILRHTFATQLAREGVQIAELRDLLGHREIKTTSQYMHTSPVTLRAAIQKHPLSQGA